MSPSRISLCLFWAISVAVTVVIWVLVLDVHDTPQSPNVGSKPSTVKQLTSSLNKKRKLFHALAVIMFVPGMLYEPAFLLCGIGRFHLPRIFEILRCLAIRQEHPYVFNRVYR
jgi:hypothetical protein